MMESCACAMDDDVPKISAHFHPPAAEFPTLDARGGAHRRGVLVLSAVPVVDWLVGLRSGGVEMRWAEWMCWIWGAVE